MNSLNKKMGIDKQYKAKAILNIDFLIADGLPLRFLYSIYPKIPIHIHIKLYEIEYKLKLEY